MKKRFYVLALLAISTASMCLSPMEAAAILNVRFANHLSDDQAFHFAESHSHCYIALSYPCVRSKDAILERILQKYGTIIHKKTVALQNNEPRNLVRLCYKHDRYTAKQLSSIYHAAFPNNHGSVVFYLYTCDSLEKVRRAKAEIRSIYKIRGAIHATDYHYQTLELARPLFSANGTHF